MPELIAKPALTGQETLGGVTLSAWDAGQITSVALFPGGAKAAAKALKPLGLAFPAPNAMVQKGDARLVWTGRDQAFLMGAPLPAIEAAVTDQTDAWAGISVTGAGSETVLMRLIPLDLRLQAFPEGRAVRAPLGHMSMILMRPAPDRFELLVFRSMARTAWHELHEAALKLAARAEAG